MTPHKDIEDLDDKIDKMLTWDIDGQKEPVIFQPEMKKAIKELIQAEVVKARSDEIKLALPLKGKVFLSGIVFVRRELDDRLHDDCIDVAFLETRLKALNKGKVE